ncbi:MAG: DASS family sodium-coupled anion symporter [Planctomycetota bacterium]
MVTDRPRRRGTIQLVGLVLGPVAAGLAYALSSLLTGGEDGLSEDGRAVIAMMAWMVAWWLTEAVDVSVTALLPLVVLPLGTDASIREAAAPYANPVIGLFFGGFVLGLAMERSGLHKRIALVVLNVIGSGQKTVIAGFMCIAAFMSMWISNTASAVMMLPIGLSVAAVFDEAGDEADSESDGSFGKALLLGLAYAASIGGIGTLIGTPPNAFFAGYVQETYGRTIGFAEWLAVGVPLVIVFVPIVWFMLTNVLFRLRRGDAEAAGRVIAERRQALGPMTSTEWVTMVVFLMTACLWITRPLLTKIEIDEFSPFAGLSDAGIAIIAAISLFAIPSNIKTREFVLEWSDLTRLPWGVLLLFGGGLSLAGAIQGNGIADLIAGQAGALDVLPMLLIVALVALVVTFLTELTSNTATAATLLPVLGGVAVALDVDPVLLLVPATVAASCAFMMPVATPPNAVVFASGRLTIPLMARTGFLLNLIGVVLVTALTYLLAMPILGAVAEAAG